MEVQVNLWGVVAAVAASMVIGAVWYSKHIFGRTWSKLIKLDEKKARQDMPKAMLAMLLMSGVTAYVLAHLAYISFTFFGYSFLSSSVITAFWLWLGFSATSTLTLGIFERRDTKLTLINMGCSLITFLLMGLAIGMVGF